MPFPENLDFFAEPPDEASRASLIEALKTHFDAAYYLERYPDIAAAGIDPLEHYIRSGWKEGRDPDPEFSTRAYLEANPEIAEAGVNPFLHHVFVIWSATDAAPAPEETGPEEAGPEVTEPEATGPEVTDAGNTQPEPVAAEPAPERTDAGETRPDPALDSASGEPDPLLDDGVIDEIERIRSVFDAEFYLSKNPGVADAGFDPVEHYVRFGWKEGRDPSPGFSTRAYLEANPDVAEAEVNPLLHHVLLAGIEVETEAPAVEAEAPDETEAPAEEVTPVVAAPEAPAPSDTPEAEADDDILDEIDRIRSVFDVEFYLSKYPGVADAGFDAVEHYVRFGWKEGRDPSPAFSTRAYLEANPDVAASGRNPLLHYATDGKQEGRRGKPAGLTVPEAEIDPDLLDEMDRIRSAFDAEFYLTKNPGVADAGFDPVEHYVRFGWKEGRDPSPAFSTRYYLEENPGVAATGRNPFLHYVVDGRKEGRRGCPED